MKNAAFQSLAKNFKAVFLDSYGVLKNHGGLIEGVQDSIDFIRNEGITLRVLTNDSSRSQHQQKEVFEALGLSGLQEEEIITSGMLARQFLELKITTGKIAYLGTENSASYILQSGLEHVAMSDIDLDNPEAIEDISALVFLDDEGFNWNTDINRTVNFLRRKNLPVIVANSDKYYPVSNSDVAIAIGGISRLVEYIADQKFMRFGKPDSQMFMYAFDDINETGNYTKADVLMVGDTLSTDILGGNKFGLKTMLVLSGNTRAENVDARIQSTGIIPDYVGKSILL